MRERYKITDVVGRGGMGNVYRAEDLRLPGRLCAIKEVQPEANISPEASLQEQSQFLREASLLAQLDHPNLPKVSDFFTDGGRDYLVMDFVPGKNLKEIIDDSRFQGQKLIVNVVMNWAMQIMDAMEYLHNQDPSVLHRDIKPANIMWDPENNTVKITDFGIARIGAPVLTRTGTILGTSSYLSPEQAQGKPVDARSDIFSLGVVLYEMASGERPFCGRTEFELSSAVLGQDQARHDVGQDQDGQEG